MGGGGGGGVGGGGGGGGEGESGADEGAIVSGVVGRRISSTAFSMALVRFPVVSSLLAVFSPPLPLLAW